MSEQDFTVTQEERREETLRFNEQLSSIYGTSNFETEQEILKVGNIKMNELYNDNEEAIIVDGVYFNSRGFEICGQLNQHSKPCQRIGKCPFHKKVENLKSSRDAPIKKAPYKQGWTKEEHLLFLNGLHLHGKGAWKEISMIVRTRTPTQIQSHAQKYFLRQKQDVKHKRSIHDVSLEEIHDQSKDSLVGYPNYPPMLVTPQHQDYQQFLLPVFPPFTLSGLGTAHWFQNCVPKGNYDYSMALANLNGGEADDQNRNILVDNRENNDDELKDPNSRRRYDNVNNINNNSINSINNISFNYPE